MTTVWVDDKKNACVLTRPNGTTCILRQGDFIGFEHRETGIRIDEFRSREGDTGPIGFSYSVWREKECRWASYRTNHFGTPIRYIVCYPCGIQTYGQHILNWNTVQHIDNGRCPDEV